MGCKRIDRIVDSDVRASLNRGRTLEQLGRLTKHSTATERRSIYDAFLGLILRIAVGADIYSYPLADVSAFRFAVIVSAKGAAFWGLRFRPHGRKWALPGLEAPEAKQILTGLRALGADVPDDPK